MENESSNNPLDHTSNIKKEFLALVEHLRQDVSKVDDPAAKALFEVSAEVIIGLHKAFEDYEKKNEEAWQN
jgi:cytoplasmic iron level regulating protein YaaA (DUF328/UPF0246 family)